LSDRANAKSVPRRVAVLYSIAMACLGLMIGSMIGGMLMQSIYGEMMGMLIGDRTQERYVDSMRLLKLIDDGENDRLRQTLLTNVQDGTTRAVDMLKLAPEMKRGALPRYVRFSGTLKSVQADDSELGRAAALARKDPIVGDDATAPKN
jgi:hypothetical protein